MSIPGQTLNIKDPGLGMAEAATMRPLCFGPASTGDYAVHLFSSPTDAAAYYSEGQLVELVTGTLGRAGSPVLCCRSAASVTASNSAVTKTAVAGGTGTGTITVAGTPLDDYEVVIETTDGTVGTGTFRVSLDNGADGGDTWSPWITIPAGATYEIPTTGLTLTFVPGGGSVYFETGDSHAFTATAAMWNSVDLAGVIAACSSDSNPWRFLVGAGEPATAAAAAVLFSALDTHMTALANAYKFRRAMISGGGGTAAAAASALTPTSTRILQAFGRIYRTSGNPIMGRGLPNTPIVNAFCERAVGPKTNGLGIPSTDLKRVLSGPISGVATNADGSPKMSHDERTNEILDSKGVSTFRTYEGQPGVYPTQGRLKSPAGSDFVYWPLGLLMDIACETVYAQQFLWTGEDVRTNDDGTIDARDAERIRAGVLKALRAQLTSKSRASGQRGYVQEVDYTIVADHDVMSTGTIASEVAIKPFRTIDGFETNLGFVRQILVLTNVSVAA